ncbi:hypothetical protein PR003_g27353 [Phytophthora rubi]|nr:hypothetical protein PR003_g27353 [Phytophthora rubi]
MQCLVLLVLALFCAGSHVAEALTRPEQATSSAATTRLLRSDKAKTVDDTRNTITSDGEERERLMANGCRDLRNWTERHHGFENST